MTPLLGDWATATAAVSTEEEAFAAKESRPTRQPPGPLEPPPLSEPEVVVVLVVVVVVVVPEPSSEPEPEEPPPEPSRPELVEVLLVLSPLPCPSADGWATAVVSPEPSCPLPETPPS